MQQATVEIINKLGLHARAAAKLIGVTSAYGSTVALTNGAKTIDGKSIMSVMMLAASQGTELSIAVEGDDEEAALAAIVALIADRFGEEE